jgi:hypothetical protein
MLPTIEKKNKINLISSVQIPTKNEVDFPRLIKLDKFKILENTNISLDHNYILQKLNVKIRKVYKYADIKRLVHKFE